MKFFITLILILILGAASIRAQQPDGVRISGSFRNMSFGEMIDKLEHEYPVHFYFDEKWISGLKVNLEANQLSLPDLLQKVLGTTLLDFVYTPPGTIYLLPDRKFVKDLPAYFYASTRDSLQNSRTEPDISGERYLQGRRPDMIRTIVIGSYDKGRKGKTAVVTGKLTDEETGEALVGATLYIPALQKGTATDVSGFLTIALKPGVYSAVFRYLGMSDVNGNLDVRSDGFFSLTLKKQVQEIDEVLIQGQKSEKRGSRLGMENVSVKTMKELPALMGERDVMKVAQMLPGIVSVGEGSAGVNVRGGNADQNLFYINDIPIYNSSHLFGFFSSVNSAIIENFSVYKGQIPAEYGGRLSSVFNVETRKGHKKDIFSQGGVSPVSANAEVELPVVREKVSLILSARSSYSDWILRRLDDPDLRNSQASFYDFAAALDFDLSNKNQVGVFAYNSNDQFNLNGYTEYAYGNKGASVNYVHRFTPGLKSSVSLVGSNYNFETIEKRTFSDAYRHAYELNHYEMKASLNWNASETHTFKIGTEAIFYDLNRGMVSPYGEGSFKVPVDLGREQGLETSLFFDDNISIGSRVNLYAGLRYSIFTELGPKTVRNYYPDAPFDELNVSGTSDYKSGDQISAYSNPEARAGLELKIRPGSSLKFSFTQMSQYLFMLSNSISIAPNDQWKLVDSHIKPPTSSQYSAGYYVDIPKRGLTFSSEIYYKLGKNVVEYRDGADFLASPFVETAILQGTQDAYGAELMLSRPVGRLNGWISYTYSRSYITVDGTEDWADINQGKRYPSNFDKPHVLNTILNYKLNRRFSVTSNLAYNTGRPITMPKGIYYVDNLPFVDYSDRNAYRIPDYFRVDLALKIEGNLKSVKPIHSYWTVSVYNLTGRKNANSIFFLSEEGKLHGYKYSVIGVPIFTISWNWKLGNYENN